MPFALNHDVELYYETFGFDADPALLLVNGLPAGQRRQMFAVGAASSRTAALAEVTVPALVLHGDQDRLVDISGGRRTAAAIPGARFEVIEGLGHDYPPTSWSTIVGHVAAHAHAVDQR